MPKPCPITTTFGDMAALKYPNSLLFKISGNGLGKPSYLLGTMHMICAEDFQIKARVLRTLSQCTHYYMEVDLGSAVELDLMQAQQSSTIDFSSDLSEKERDQLAGILQKDHQLTLEEAEQLPPVALINKMTTDAIDCEEIKVAEMELLSIAHMYGLQTGGLETALQQLQIAEKVFDGKELLRQLKSSDDYKGLFSKMITAYHTEDLLSLANYVTDKRFMSRKAYRILVIDRNKRWARQIPKLIGDKKMFIAVGAGHLPGEEGLIHLLQQQGFQVNPVYR